MQTLNKIGCTVEDLPLQTSDSPLSSKVSIDVHFTVILRCRFFTFFNRPNVSMVAKHSVLAGSNRTEYGLLAAFIDLEALFWYLILIGPVNYYYTRHFAVEQELTSCSYLLHCFD